MSKGKGAGGRFIVGAGLEFVGIIALAASLGANLGGVVMAVAGGVALLIGVALQVSAFLIARREAE